MVPAVLVYVNMATIVLKESKLKAGEHFGVVSEKSYTTSAVISESVYKTKASLPEHSHELAFFTLILKGGYSEKYGGKRFAYSPMTVLWRGPETSHEDSIDAAGSHFFFIEIARTCLDKLFQYERRVPEHLFEQNGALSWLASRLRHEVAEGEVCVPLIAEGITLEMLAHLTRKNVTAETRAPKWLRRVVERLNDEFTENISCEELAAEAKVHPVHLASTFRRFYNQTIGEYTQKKRVAHASQLLLDREIPLTEIAYSAGFSDQSHFTRVFKRFTGLTPGAFRGAVE